MFLIFSMHCERMGTESSLLRARLFIELDAGGPPVPNSWHDDPLLSSKTSLATLALEVSASELDGASAGFSEGAQHLYYIPQHSH